MSFQKLNGFNDVSFIGLKNYKRLFNVHYYKAIWNSLRYTFWTIFVLVPLPLLLAVLLNNKLTIGKTFFRSVFFLPALTSVIVAGMFFRYAFGSQDATFMNAILGKFGIPARKWLMEANTGMLALVVLCTWRWLGVNIVYFLSGLQNISPELYESAEIDGANAVQKLFYITLPSLRPVTTYVITISVYGGLSMFAESFSFWTARSPEDIGLTLVGYIYSAGFTNNDLGLASAIGVTLIILIMAITAAQLFMTGFFKKEQ
ncbi:carbohydrate ABC transporter permease [Treponema primitia]|uniref:carbohydrate ABC transporter permease n=1 Tax=Treponema primitia TaxID=88058 RepID=UPI001E2C2984|nr:sugar ABC transporter permease [Treponema primitia]